MLEFDPRKRIDATNALAHEYLAPYHDPSDEPIAPEPFDWSFNDADLPVDTWKIMMYSEILDFHNIENAEGANEGAVAGTTRKWHAEAGGLEVLELTREADVHRL